MQDRNKLPIVILICDDHEADRPDIRRTLEAAHVANELRFVTGVEQMLDYLHQRGAFAGETGAAPRPGLILYGVDEGLPDLSADRAFADVPIVPFSKPLTMSALVTALQTLDGYWLEVVAVPPRLPTVR
jgi:hypothetical protein